MKSDTKIRVGDLVKLTNERDLLGNETRTKIVIVYKIHNYTHVGRYCEVFPKDESYYHEWWVKKI